MITAEIILNEVLAFNERWGRGKPSLREQADMLQDARTLKLHATKAALAAVADNDRDFFRSVRRVAGEHVQSLRRELAFGDST